MTVIFEMNTFNFERSFQLQSHTLTTLDLDLSQNNWNNYEGIERTQMNIFFTQIDKFQRANWFPCGNNLCGHKRQFRRTVFLIFKTNVLVVYISYEKFWIDSFFLDFWYAECFFLMLDQSLVQLALLWQVQLEILRFVAFLFFAQQFFLIQAKDFSSVANMSICESIPNTIRKVQRLEIGWRKWLQKEGKLFSAISCCCWQCCL